MAFLEKFSAEERTLLVALPFRVGLWISQIDEIGNPGASEEERRVLETVIARQAGGMFHSAFAHEIMAELWAGRPQWDQWDKDLDQVLRQCASAARMINLRLTRRDLDAYRATLMYIATEVAKAFREKGGRGALLTNIYLKMLLWRGRLGSFLRGEAYDPVALLNISDTEENALSALGRALSVGAAVSVDPLAPPPSQP